MVISSRRGFILPDRWFGVQASSSGLHVGPQVWLPLARREEITTVRNLP